MNALERGAAYLSLRPRTGKQVSDYLIDKGYAPDEVKEAVLQLIEYKYIDDKAFARMYVEYGFEKGRGLERIKRELVTRGVAGDVIEDVLYEMEDEGELPDEFPLALQIGHDVIRDVSLASLEYKERRKMEARVGRRLAARGFCNDVIFKVIRSLGE